MRWLTSALLAATCLTPLTRTAAQSCSTVGGPYGTYICSVPSGTYTSNITFTAPTFVDNNNDANPMTVTSQGTMTVPADQVQALNFIASAGQGGYGQGLTIDNQGAVTITGGQGGNNLFGLYSRLSGGDGANADLSSSSPGGAGGSSGISSSQQLTVTNSGAITINLPTVTVGNGAALYALTQGGNGGASGTGYDGVGAGSGGNATGAVITNTGAISVSLAGANGYGGIEALGQGGSGGGVLFEGEFNGGASGGAGGSSSVTNSAAVNVTWAWQSASTPNYGLFGILAQSIGGNGSGRDGGNGGAGGYGPTPSAFVTLTAGGNVSVAATGTPAANAISTFYGAGVAAQLFGGNGGYAAAASDIRGGDAGWVGSAGQTIAQIKITDASVTTSGEGLPAVLVMGQGGAGGNGGGPSSQYTNYPDNNGGKGGLTGDSIISITASTSPVAISTAGTNSPAIVNLLQGGNGGSGGSYDGTLGIAERNAGYGGAAGYAGSPTITLQGTSTNQVTVTTTGQTSPGIYAATIGGNGGNGGNLMASLGASGGGVGGAGGGSGYAVAVSLVATKVTTQGTSSPGIVALSLGGTGGAGGNTEQTIAQGAGGGDGGASGNVTVTLDSASSITTSGTDASGVVAQSVSGAGGNAGATSGTISGAGANGGSGGATGTVTVTNDGAISTAGDTARGILAQAVSGGGGSGGSAYGVLYGGAGSGGSTGTINPLTVTNDGSIATSGANAQGILAQSFAGGGGAGGQAGSLLAAVGGNASTNPLTADAGSVTVNLGSGGSISTQGMSSIGVLGQSIGGGGGDGGGVQGSAVGVGGSGGQGGAGGTASASVSGAAIKTLGDNAHGIVMQSVGGGGGNAGNVTGGIGLFTSVAIGGSGGSGGAGGTVSIDLSNNASISTEGSKAAGLVVQSVGGGGGTGGQAFTGSVGAGFSASVAVGGSGGTGGNAGQATGQLVGGSIATGQNSLLVQGTGASGSCTSLPCNLLPVDAYGAVVQNIGGGGGLGGSALAKALAFAVPVTPEGGQVAVSSAVSLGGAGGSGGDGNAANFAVSQGGKIVTSGQGSTGVLLQSIGGGGGAGGDSSALSATIGYGESLPDSPTTVSLNTTFVVGGTGGSGGSGGPVYMGLGGLVSMVNGSPVFTADAAGSPTSTITTYGDFAGAIKAQSIGGGGGDAGYGGGKTQDFGSGTNLSLNVTLGATGGTGGHGGAVIAQLSPTSAITTWGSSAIGVLAQSIGGGGGASQGGSYSFGGTLSDISPQVKIEVGTQGGIGGKGGNVTVDVQGAVTTHGGDAVGVLAQSIGGGGGLGGSAGSDASADNPIVAALNARELQSAIQSKSVPWDGTFTVALGGSGGFGNKGGTVDVSLGSTIATSGDWASGIVAQSIGGGGGKGGTAAATGTGGTPEITINLNIAVGGTGGTGGDGGQVTTGLGTSISGSSITTAGYGASGVIAQSVGGGGGMAADGSDGAWGLLAVGTGAGGGGGAAGNGGSVTLTTTNANTIKTTGETAHAVLLQSVGGGGGIAGAGSSFDLSVVRQSIPATSLSAGGGAGASGAGGTVTFNDQGAIAITTSGNNAFGILAQSVGGGGGIVSMSQGETRQAVALGALSTQIGGSAANGEPNNNGGAVSVTLNSGSSISTSGTGAHGIVAQSIGGGGGIVGLPGTAPALTTAAPSGYQQAANGLGSTVTVTHGGQINVTGTGAIGILAQSVGSGGGLLLETDGKTVFAGSSGASLQGSGGHGAAVTVNVTTTGIVSAAGANGIGIFAQSTGHTASENGPVNVTVDGIVAAGYNQSSGIAVQIDSQAGSPGGTVTVGSGGSIQALSGTAILASGGGSVIVNNQGNIIGEVTLNGGQMRNSGTYSPGPTLQHDLVNIGRVIIRRTSTVGNNTITTDSGGITAFLDAASGGMARYVTNAGGTFDISLLTTNGTTAGSIEGAGTYYLGAKQLTVGANDASTTVSGVIADGGLGSGGGGSLVKMGGGTLTLTGANTYTGGTTVLGGVLVGNSTSLQGNILNNASVVFNQTGTGTYAGIMSGSGSMTLLGGGVLNLTGYSTYTGPTTVDTGTLSVNGSLASVVDLVNGGTLSGSGSVGGIVFNGGVLAPGNSIGTLTVNGNFSQNGGTYQVEINLQGHNDLVNVAGTATIGGGATVQVLPQSGSYQRNTTYTILAAQGRVLGTYSGVRMGGGYAFLVPSLSYDANDVYLTLASAFAAGAQTPNQYAVGAALDQANASASGDFDNVLNALFNLNTQLGPAALNTLSGQPIANFGTVNIQSASLFMSTLGQQLSMARSGVGLGQRVALAEACETATCEPVGPWSAWAGGLGGLGSVLGNGNTGTITYNFGGAAMGIDYRFDPRFLFGLGVGYAHGSQGVSGFSGQSWTDSVSVALYGSFTQAGFYADALAGYAYSVNQVQRQILIPGLAQRTANGSTGANQFLGQLETGYQIPIWASAQATLTPFARLQGSMVTQNAFDESGAQSINLNVAQQTTSSLRTVFGAEIAGAIPLGGQRALDVALRAGWQHEYASTARPMTAAFAGAPVAAFTVYGAAPQSDSAMLGFSAKTNIAAATQLYLRYDGEFASAYNNHAFTAGLRMSW